MKRIFLTVLILALSVAGITRAQDEPGTILDVAAELEGMSTLATALGMADPAAGEMLASEGPFTLLAPNDAAFSTFGTENAALFSTAIGDPAILTAILQYHLLVGEYTSETLLAQVEEAGGTLEVPSALEGEVLTFTVEDEALLVNGIAISSPDNMASNGVVHVIDGVLVPPSLGGGATAAPEETAEPLAPSYVMEVEEGEPGSEDDPLVLLFIPSENAQEVQAGADELAALITEKTGLAVVATVATDYSAAIEALCSEEADIAALATFSYLLASERECAEVGVVSVRNGSPFYQGQIITRADSGITSVADLAGQTFCRPDELSTSGWIFPSIAMRAEGIDPEADIEPIDAGGHDGVVTSVYNGDCAAGATFVDARTRVEGDLPDVMEQVVVIGTTAPIPNDTLSFSVALDEEVKANLVSALVEIATDEANVELLNAVYSWTGLEPAEDAFFDDLREQLEAAGVSVEDFMN